MTDHDALLRAICHSPDDDTPRLIYADWLEESGEAARAEFVRSQVELARTPDWEPFAVLCRTRKLEWSEAGEPFRDSLPALGPGVEWHPQPFRRGLGWRVNAGDLRVWEDVAPRLMESAPIGELELRVAATRDDWRSFAAGPWMERIRVLHLHGGSPVEATRALCESQRDIRLTDLHFHRSSSPGMPELVADLLASPLGKGLRGLHFYVGYQAVDELVDGLGHSNVKLDRLTFHTMGMSELRLGRLFLTPIVAGLVELDLANDRIPDALDDFSADWPDFLPRTLNKLRVANALLDRTDMDALARNHVVRGLFSLDLRGNVAAGSQPFVKALGPERLRSLDLRGCRLGQRNWEDLIDGPHWTRLVEVDLRNNLIDHQAMTALLHAPLPEELTALLVDEQYVEPLAAKFGECVVSPPED